MQKLDINSLPLTVKPGDRQQWSGLGGAALGLVLANCSRQFQGLTLILTENSHQAERLHDELVFFAHENGIDKQHLITEFPDWETLPYDNFSPHQDIISQRLETLFQLPNLQQGILIVSVTTLMHRLVPRSYILGNSLMLQVGQQLPMAVMRRQLEAAGYYCVDCVYEHGEFAVRGSIIDIFPMGSKHPYRIELFDDEIESLRSFDPETQLSRDKVDEIRLLPGKEFPLNEADIARFRRNFREAFNIDVRRCPLYEDVSQGFATPGIEYYLPLFFDEQQSLFDYLPDKVMICSVGELEQSAWQFWRDVKARYQDRCIDPQRPILEPGALFMPADEVLGRLHEHPRIHFQYGQKLAGKAHYNLQSRNFPDLSIQQKLHEPLVNLKNFLSENSATPVLFACDSAGRRETLLDLLATIAIRPEVVDGWQDFYQRRPALAITVAPLETGLWLEAPDLIVIAESQ
ncbi:MAG: transcription-repair coupling factor, partial [Pseudohongiellaceae bacterium]